MGEVKKAVMWKPSPTPADNIDPYRGRWVNDDEDCCAIDFVQMPTEKSWPVHPDFWSQAAH